MAEPHTAPHSEMLVQIEGANASSRRKTRPCCSTHLQEASPQFNGAFGGILVDFALLKMHAEEFALSIDGKHHTTRP